MITTSGGVSRMLALVLILILNTTLAASYAVPKARIEVLHPKGFSVSVPDHPGITTFSFHGNLNSPMEGLENGQFSADILKHRNGRWTFTNRKHEIKPGDVLYYWLYVQKDSLGYRRDDQKHEFTGIQFEFSTILRKLNFSSLHTEFTIHTNFNCKQRPMSMLV